MIVVTAPTGIIGRQVLENVFNSGEPVRVIARDPLLRDCAERRARTGACGIALDVEPNPLELPLLTNLPDVSLFLPERTSCSS